MGAVLPQAEEHKRMRHFYFGSRHRAVLAISAMVAVAALGMSAGSGVAEEAPESIRLEDIPAVKQLQREQTNSGERHIRRAIEAAKERAMAKKKGKKVAAQRSRPAPPSDVQPTAEQLRRHAELERANPPLTQAVPSQRAAEQPGG
jgi:hypothetical protein